MNTKLIALLIVALSLGAGATSAQETDRDTVSSSRKLRVASPS
jgi:hypothetical protein